MQERLKKIKAAATYIGGIIGDARPRVGIVLGSGLGGLADQIEEPIIIPYKDIPFFPVSTVIRHKGNLIFGKLGGKNVVAMQGRFHYYEGYSMDMLTMPVRVMKLLGIKEMFVSNAAGGANPDFKVGDMVIIRDHISTLPNPLMGPNMSEFGPRFPDMTCAYDQKLQDLAMSVSSELGFELKKGVYMISGGPSYETPAEVRYFRMVGADLLGMSTVPEVITARHCGIRVFGVSVVTNCCNTENIERNLNDGEDVVAQADKTAIKMTGLFRKMIERL